MKRSEYKMVDGLSENDINRNCRSIINTRSHSYRVLKRVLRKAARKKIRRYDESTYAEPSDDYEYEEYGYDPFSGGYSDDL